MGEVTCTGSTVFTPSGKGAFTFLSRFCSELTPPRASEMSARRFNLLLATCLLATFHLSAQPKAFASLNPERIETGDTTSLLVIVTGLNIEPKDVDFSPWASVFPASNIVGRSAWRRSGLQWTRRFTLIAFDSATLELPPLFVRLGVGKPLETNELTLTVFPTRSGREITDMAKIRDIRRESESWLDYLPWAAGGLAVLLLLFWWLWKTQRKPQPIVLQTAPATPPVSASVLALQQLSELQQKQLWKNGQAKEHYAQLSLILREYLETRFAIAALESTTAEIQKMLATTDFPLDLRPDLKELLQKTDMVKYAQSEPPEATHETVLVKARELVAPGQAKKQEPKKTPARKPPPKISNSGKYESL